MKKVLVLNADYLPIGTIPVARAISLIVRERVEVVEKYTDVLLKTVKTAFTFPAVIRLLKYVKVAFVKRSPSRSSIYKRDKYKCVYCSTSNDLTLDHVIPKSKGGKNTWSNLVTACKKCNSRKGDRTPEEAGMGFSNLETSKYSDHIVSFNVIQPEWNQWLI